ncbi:unnamed protein product [Sphagnum troendelagicum]
MANDGVVGLVVYDARMCAYLNGSNSEHLEQPARISSIYQCFKSAGIVVRLLALAKPSNGNNCLQWARFSIGRSIVLYVFSSEVAFSSHLLPHQFGMAIKDRCEGVVDGI